MQKLLQRTAMAKRQAARRAERRAEKARSNWMRSNREEKIEQRRLELADIKAARVSRREDWELGPIAPRRDVGDVKDTYGTINPRRLNRVELPKHMKEKYFTLTESDRVVVLEGREKGKIGVIRRVNVGTGGIILHGMNLVDIAMPEWMRKANNDPTPVRTMEAEIPQSAVRLVYPVPDPETGIPRDVIVDRLEVVPYHENAKIDENAWPPEWDRVIPGLDMVVPWPAREKPEEKDHDVDTLRILSEERTFVPVLLRPPMPPSVIDELRNKYSKFRERHDDEYIAKKMEEDAEKEKKKRLTSMMTPLQELHARERRERKARGRPELSDDQLAKIGEVMMARRRSSHQKPLEKAPEEVVTLQMEGLNVKERDRSPTA